MNKLLILLLLLWISLPLYSQSLHIINPADYNLDSLKIYGKNKKFISGFELQSLIALSYYPELKRSRITFKLANKESLAKTTVTFFSLFNSIDKHFVIYINRLKTNTGILLKDASFNAQVGAIAHELGHVANFKNKSLPEMIWWGISYLNKKQRKIIERNTDKSVIEHSLGWQLYDFTYFVLNDSTVNDRYKKFKLKNYLHPEEIAQLMKEESR